MSAHYWIELRNWRRVVLFSAAIVLLALFWHNLPPDVKGGIGHYGRGIMNPRNFMFAGWIGGWFTLLFLRVEDLNVLAPVDYQGLCRVLSCLLIAGALTIAGFYSYAFFA
jgi:hypothetical protein